MKKGFANYERIVISSFNKINRTLILQCKVNGFIFYLIQPISTSVKD